MCNKCPDLEKVSNFSWLLSLKLGMVLWEESGSYVFGTFTVANGWEKISSNSKVAFEFDTINADKTIMVH